MKTASLFVLFLALFQPSLLSAVETQPVGMTVVEMKKLHFEFMKAQKSEVKAVEHQQKMQMDELKASQRAQLREWEEKEKTALKDFTAKKPKGPEMRSYIQNRKERRNALLKLQQDEMDKKRQDHTNQINRIRYDHSVKLKTFMDHLSRKEKPPENLWPGAGQGG